MWDPQCGICNVGSTMWDLQVWDLQCGIWRACWGSAECWVGLSLGVDDGGLV